MARFIIERNFAEKLEITKEGNDHVNRINDEEGVKWIFSFLSADKRKTYCLYGSIERRGYPPRSGSGRESRPRRDHPGRRDRPSPCLHNALRGAQGCRRDRANCRSWAKPPPRPSEASVTALLRVARQRVPVLLQSSLLHRRVVEPALRVLGFDVDTWPGCYGRLIGHSRSFGCWRWYG